MIKYVEMIPTPEPSHLSRLCRQAGVDYAVGGLPAGWPADRHRATMGCPAAPPEGGLRSLRLRAGLIEARPPLNLAKRGLPGRDEEIATVCTLLENMGKLGIPTWCYEWMTDFNWLRTSTNAHGRGGSLVSAFDASKLAGAPPTELGPIDEGSLWGNLD